MIKGYYVLTKKEGDFIKKLLEKCIDYPYDSKSALIAIGEVMDIGFRDSLRSTKYKITPEHLKKLHEGRAKFFKERKMITERMEWENLK